MGSGGRGGARGGSAATASGTAQEPIGGITWMTRCALSVTGPRGAATSSPQERLQGATPNRALMELRWPSCARSWLTPGSSWRRCRRRARCLAGNRPG
eukprot:1407722-Lingulodinium_polyedra.AAC.1